MVFLQSVRTVCPSPVAASTYFIGTDERPEEDTFAGPLFERKLEMRPRTVEVDEGAQQHGQLDAGALDDGPCERSELGVHGTAGLCRCLRMAPSGA